MALMACSQDPTYFNGVQAVVPITDLEKRYSENIDYRKHMEYCIGGPPEGEALAQYHKRSPMHYAEALSKACVYAAEKPTLRSTTATAYPCIMKL